MDVDPFYVKLVKFGSGLFLAGLCLFSLNEGDLLQGGALGLASAGMFNLINDGKEESKAHNNKG